jgi:hypothetical protein
MNHKDLQPAEECLIGTWLDRGGRIEGDFTYDRIQWLLAERLERVATDASGWDTLWRDGRDGPLWELSYPQSHLHGGGPPELILLTREAGRVKYGDSAA